jgi:IS1 family transposase
MRLSPEKAETILRLLVEGMSIRSVERITDVHRDTILRLLVKAGERCEAIMGRLIVNVPVKDVECDEIWAFVQKKEGHKGPKETHNETIGDAYCFVAVERHSKLVLNFALGRRNQATTNAFIEGLRLATSSQHFQITADGFPAYPNSIDSTLSDRVDFAQLIKVYGASPDGEARYSPAEVLSTERVPVLGNPDPARICTSIVERQNLTIRMQMRRLTRLTNAFSKKWDNLWAAYCLHFAWYNFCRVHRTLRVTPAMEANIADHIWTISELLEAA